MAIYVNGAAASVSYAHTSVTSVISAEVSDILYIGSGIDIELYAYSGMATSVVDIDNGETRTFMAVHLLST
jgi:hypothetical protein